MEFFGPYMVHVNAYKFAGAVFSADEVKARYLNKATEANSRTRKDSVNSNATTTPAGATNSRFQSRFLPAKPAEKTVEPVATKKQEEEEDDEEETTSSSETTESESEEESDSSEQERTTTIKSGTDVRNHGSKPEVAPTLARSSIARERESYTGSTGNTSGGTSSAYRRKTPAAEEPPAPTSVSSYRRNRATSPPSREYGTSSSSSRYVKYKHGDIQE